MNRSATIFRVLGSILLLVSFAIMYYTEDYNLLGLLAGICAGLGVLLLIKGSFKRKK